MRLWPPKHLDPDSSSSIEHLIVTQQSSLDDSKREQLRFDTGQHTQYGSSFRLRVSKAVAHVQHGPN